ncbi:MAG TPA: hypothetical protein VHF70_04310 [Rubrobacteraceae bacterium]|nr:hypothetical protein [Rubrobacteraceae bacterium]
MNERADEYQAYKPAGPASHEVTGRTFETAEAPRRAGDPAVLVASSQKIRAQLGWTSAEPEFTAMISDARDWMQANPHGYSTGVAGC